MTRRIFFACMVIMLSATAAALGAEKGNFGGTWILDKSKSEGLPQTVDQVMTVEVVGDKLNIETTVKSDEGQYSIKDSYTINGETVDFTPQGPNGPNGKGRRTAKLTADGLGIEVNEDATLDTDDGAVKAKMARKWLLSSDQQTLTIELTFDGPQGTIHTKRTFVKKS